MPFKPVHSLLIVSLLSALIWRMEVELRGWGGLGWIGYYHLSIPASGMLFMSWTWCVMKSDPRRKKIVTLATLWGGVAIVVLEYTARAYFVSGPSAIAYLVVYGSLFDHLRWIGPTVWAVAILVLYGGYRCLFRFSPAVGVTGFAWWLSSWHLGLLVIAILPERGNPNLIHALKTGWMIPFCVLAVGLPIAYREPVPRNR